jgi:hypothetical protein
MAGIIAITVTTPDSRPIQQKGPPKRAFFNDVRFDAV